MNAHLLGFENTCFSADPSTALVACVPVCAVCGAGDSDEGDKFELTPGAISRNGVGRVPWCGLHLHGHPHTRTGRSQAPADWRRDGDSPEACSHVRQRRRIEDGGWRAAVDGARGRGQPQILVVPVVGVTVYACVIYATEAIGGKGRPGRVTPERQLWRASSVNRWQSCMCCIA